MLEGQENFNIIGSETQKSKKFVFQLYSDNVDYIETLSYQEKNDLINSLLNDYKETTLYNKKFNKNISVAKKTVIILLSLVIGIPLLLYLTGLSLDLTKNSYSYMQKNFEKLF